MTTDPLTDLDPDPVFRARPGLSVGQLAAEFAFSRFAAMKHLRTLEEADLVVSRREGKVRRLYLNAVPIQTIHDRWISQYSALWASQLTSLKYQLEGEEHPMPATAQLTHVHVVHIRTTPEKLWEAITRPELTRLYYYGSDIVSDFRVGSPVEHLMPQPDGTRKPAITGKVLDVDPPRRLVTTFAFTHLSDAPTRVSYLIEPMGSLVKLTVTHEGFEGETETYHMIRGGWTPIIDGLKTYLETGRPLEIPREKMA